MYTFIQWRRATLNP